MRNSRPFGFRRRSPGRETLLALARKGLLDSARSAAAKGMATHPQDAFLLLLLGKLSPSGQESAEYFQKSIKREEIPPEAEEALFRLGQYTYATGKYYLAIPYFRDYLRRYPKGDGGTPPPIGWAMPAWRWCGRAGTGPITWIRAEPGSPNC